MTVYTRFDSPLQKRLSWNYGQHIPNNDLQLKTSTVAASSAKCLSSDSMQSSSGVSSTGSLHLSIGSAASGSDPQQGQQQQWTVERSPIHLREYIPEYLCHFSRRPSFLTTALM